MFEDSLFESGKQYQRRSPWVTAFSFLMQVLLIGVLVLIPILYPEALPKQQFMTFLVAPPPPPPPPPPPAAAPTPHMQKVISELNNGQLRTPTAIPKKIAKIQEEDTPAPSGGVIGGVIGGLPGGAVGGVLGGVLNSIASSVPAAVPKVATPQKVRVSSGVAQGNLIHDVKPPYPPLARQARIQGTVVISAIIGKDGTIQQARVVSGHPMLAQAALEAVKQWRYKPYFLNGEPVDVDTTINVNFSLSGG
jgi:protein TonB